jgi:hypothetical protein
MVYITFHIYAVKSIIGTHQEPNRFFDVAGESPLVGVHMKHRSVVVGIERGALHCFVCSTRQKCVHVVCVLEKLQTPPEDPDEPVALNVIHSLLMQHTSKGMSISPRRRVSCKPIALLPSQQSKVSTVSGACDYYSDHAWCVIFD